MFNSVEHDESLLNIGIGEIDIGLVIDVGVSC